jgi:hypothetical protein
MEPVSPLVARKTWRTVEPCHGFIYFTIEAADTYAELGVTGPMGYFASRAAALGAASADLVVATFYNFNPSLVRSVIPAAWDITTPEAMLEARLRAVDGGLRRVLGEAVGSPDMARAAELLRIAAEHACERPQGRPLFAAHASLDWPEQPHLVLWHGQTLLREFRGDGHIAALLTEDVGPVEALVVHAATGEAPTAMLRLTRSWPDEHWEDAVERVRSRGWLVDGELALNDAGRAHRQKVEDDTDRLSVHPYTALGDERCDELRRLARPWSRAIVGANMGAASSPLG